MERIAGTAWKIILGILAALYFGYLMGKSSNKGIPDTAIKPKTDPAPEKETVAANTEKVEAQTEKEKIESPKN